MAISRPYRVALLWVLGMGSLGLSIAASATLVPGAVTWQEAAWAMLFGSAFLAVGALLVIRRPDAIVGRISFLTGLTMAAAADLRTFAILLDRQPGPIPPIAAFAANLASVGTAFAALILGAILLARFPEGRDRGRLATIADLTILLASIGLLAGLFVPGDIEPGWLRLQTENPIGMPGLAGEVAAYLSSVSLGVYGVSVIAAAAVIVRRYGRSGSVVRAQIRWVAAAGIVPIVLFLAQLGLAKLLPPDIGDALWPAWILSTTLLPIAIGIAILRYRLYDLNRIVSRTISYAILTGLLGMAFGATVIAVSFTQGQTIAVAASTLVAFALFQPLRRRVQAAVDRRFDRARVDGERTAAAFSDRLRHEVDITTIAGELLGTIDASVKPSARSLWLRQAEP